MKVILSMAISLNGMIAREDGREDWLPAAGWDDFITDVSKFGNFIMGRQTYELVQSLYPDHNFDDLQGIPKIIVTSNKQLHASPDYTIVQSPHEALDFLNQNGVQTALLIGGGKLNAAFIKENLIDEIWLTYSPHILGKGRPLIDQSDIDIDLTSISFEQYSLGRIRAKYSVNK